MVILIFKEQQIGIDLSIILYVRKQIYAELKKSFD